MQSLLIDNISLIIFIPFWIFLIIMGGRFFSVYVNKKIIYILTVLSSFLGILVCAYGINTYTQTNEWSHPFLSINDFTILFGIYVDKLSLILGLILYLVSFAIQIFSISFMKEEKKNYRFFALLNLFNFSMSGLLFSQNFYQMYVFWEIVGVVSYLLIGFDYVNPIKSIAAKKVMLVNRFGDMALISGIILITYIMYSNTNDLSFVTLPFSDLNIISTLFMIYTSTPLFLTICGLFIIAGMVKSAQFPFHIWLQDAMEAKIPVSALLHSATMVTAGIYLIIRMMPFFTLYKILLQIVICIGLLTAIICTIFACMEKHPKKVLAYSTSANLGLMFVLAGIENIKALLIFLTAHAFIKSLLFLSLPKENRSISYVSFGLFTLSALSLSGLIFVGVPAKEALYNGLSEHAILSKIILFVIFLSAFYILKLVFLIWKNSIFQRTFSKLEILPELLILFYNIGFCSILTKGYFKLSLPYIIAISAIVPIILLYKFNLIEKLNPPKSLSEKTLYECIPGGYNYIAQFCANVDEKFLGNYKPIKVLFKSCINIVNSIEENVMNKFVKIISDRAKALSKTDMIIQSKNVQNYNAYAFIILTIIIMLVIFAYMFIITTIKI